MQAIALAHSGTHAQNVQHMQKIIKPLKCTNEQITNVIGC